MLLCSVPWSTCCQDCDTIRVVVTFISQTICHCKINLRIFSWDNRQLPKIKKTWLVTVTKPTQHKCSWGQHLIWYIEVSHTGFKTKGKKWLVLPPEIFAELKAFQAAAGSRIKPFTKDAIFCPNTDKNFRSSRFKYQGLNILNNSILYTCWCD